MFYVEHLKGFFMKKCTKCKGHKTIHGMGGMRLKCTDCKGIGFLIESKVETKFVAPVEVVELSEEPKTFVTPIIKSPNSKKVKINSVKVEQTI